MFCGVLLHAISHYLTHILVWECIPRQILTGWFESGEEKATFESDLQRQALPSWLRKKTLDVC